MSCTPASHQGAVWMFRLCVWIQTDRVAVSVWCPRVCRIIMSVNDKWHYCHNCEVLVGSRAMRDRHLKLLGYIILQVSRPRSRRWLASPARLHITGPTTPSPLPTR